jgi:hypothetical protein
MTGIELPIDCIILARRDWERSLKSNSEKYGRDFVDTQDPKNLEGLEYLSELKKIYSRQQPDCCITYLSSSGKPGLVVCQTTDEVKLTIENLYSSLMAYA